MKSNSAGICRLFRKAATFTWCGMSNAAFDAAKRSGRNKIMKKSNKTLNNSEDTIKETAENNEKSNSKKNNNKSNKKKKKKQSPIVTVLLVLVFVAGLAIVIYPVFSDWWNDRHMTKAIATYVEEVEKIDDGSRQRMIDEATAYNSRLKSLNFELTEEEYEEYNAVLNVSGTGIMGYVQIPTINVNLPIYHGTDERVLAIAVGHIEGTSLPVGGKGTHSVISGHRGLPSAKLFSDLDLLREGDVFTVSVLDRVLTYQVDQIHIVLPDEVSDLAIFPDKDYMTLVTCTPYGVNSHRMLVRGHRIDNIDVMSDVVITQEAVRISTSVVMLAIALPLVALAMLISAFIPGRRKPLDSRKILDNMEREMAEGKDV